MLLQILTGVVTEFEGRAEIIAERGLNSEIGDPSNNLQSLKTGFGVEPTGTHRCDPNGFAAREEHRLP